MPEGMQSVVLWGMIRCLLRMLRLRKCAFFPYAPALRVCESYAIRAARGNNTAAVEEKDGRVWTLVTCMNSTHALAL